MRFVFPVVFEVPDEWWIEAGLRNFKPKTTAYIAQPVTGWPTETVLLAAIRPPARASGVRNFDRERMVNILRGIRTDSPMPPVVVHNCPKPSQYLYEVRDGFHRFYASAAVGFSNLPIEIRPYFDIRAG